MAPAFLIAASARCASTFMPILQGVIVLYPLARPTMGLVKSWSWKPTARSIARFGDRCTPLVTTWLLTLSGIGYVLPWLSAICYQQHGLEVRKFAGCRFTSCRLGRV